MPVRKASAVWAGGGLRNGKGTISSESGVLKEAKYDFGSRFESAQGTNPEELIAAAHAGCFSMALSGGLEKAGFPPTRIATDAACTVEKVDGGFKVTRMHLVTRATVPNASAEQFAAAANAAKEGCPISGVMKGNVMVTLDAQLE
jgi:osmotically inducible protein OsmC